MFVILCCTFYSFRIFGNFYISELILLLTLIAKVLNGRILDTAPLIGRFNRVLFLALVGALISDMVRGSDFTNGLKGFSLIFFTLINLNALYLITRMNKTLIMYGFLGFAVSGLLSFFFQPNTYARSEVWKFGIGPSLTLILIIFLSTWKFYFRSITQAVVMASWSLMSLFLGARSLALAVFMTSYFVFLDRKRFSKRKEQSLHGLILVLVVSSLAFSSTYSILAEKGYLGQASKLKYQTQTSNGNLILNSRGEFLFAGRAILESPLIGHGSYGMMSPELRIDLSKFLSKFDVSFDVAPFNRTYGNRIPVHSMVLQWWLWFGILGLLFPLLLLRILFRTLRQRNLSPVGYFTVFSGIWSTIFSPYGEIFRILIPLTMLLCMSYLINLKKNFNE